MAVIVARPVESDEGTDFELIQLQVLIDPSDFVGKFDRLELWRASSKAGPFEELTAAIWQAPRVPRTAGDKPSVPVTGRSVVIVGKTLTLQAMWSGDGLDFGVNITFTGTDPLTLAQVATQVNNEGLGAVAAYVDTDGLFVVESTQLGNSSRLAVTGGDAAPILGLPIGDPDGVAIGHDARLSLRKGVSRYDFTDTFGARGSWYQTRMRNRSTGATSAFSQPFSVVDQSVGISSESVVIGFLDLVGIDGKPKADVEVSVFGSERVVLIDDKLVTWAPNSKKTDAKGRVEFLLARGIQATVAISGTSIVREITVPTDPSLDTFNLLGANAGAKDDNFEVVVPNITSADRRS